MLAALAACPLARAGGGFDAVDALLRDAVQPGRYLGAVALLARRGQVVHLRAYGHRDIARREPMATGAVFRIYSMTKPVVSALLLILVERGALALDDPVASHLEEFAAWKTLTVRHLATHTAGFAVKDGDAHFDAMQRADPQGAATLAEVSRLVATVPPAARPGARFAYDGLHTEVLCRVIEVAAKRPFETLLRERILDPLDMADTGFEVPRSQRHRIAEITTADAEGRLVAAPLPPAGERLRAYASGAGGLYSTASDVHRLAQALLDARLLSPAGVATMTRDQLPQLAPLPGLGAGQGFGIGVSVVTDPSLVGRHANAGAWGWPGAAGTTFTVDPSTRMIAILMLQHLPRDGAPNPLPRLSQPFFDRAMT